MKDIFIGWTLAIIATILLPLPRLYSDDRPGIKIDYELSGITQQYKESNEGFFVIQNEKDFTKIVKLISEAEQKRLKDLLINFDNQIGVFVFSRYKNRPEVLVTIEEVNRQGPQKLNGGYVFDEVHIYCDVEYIRGNRETDTKQSYWRFTLLSRDKLRDENFKTSSPITDKTKFILFKRILVDSLQEPTIIK